MLDINPVRHTWKITGYYVRVFTLTYSVVVVDVECSEHVLCELRSIRSVVEAVVQFDELLLVEAAGRTVSYERLVPLLQLLYFEIRPFCEILQL